MIRKINNIVSCAEMAALGGYHHANLEPACTYYRSPPFFIDSLHTSDQGKNNLKEVFANTRTDAPPVRIFRLKNALVYGQGSLVLESGSIVYDSVAEFLNHGLAPDGSHKVQSDIILDNDPKKYLSGSSLLVKRPWYRNFGHWLVDLMPIVAIVKKYDINFDNIILGDVPTIELKNIMRKTIETVFPGKKPIYIDDKCQINCQELAYMAPVHVPPFIKHPAALAAAEQLCRSIFQKDVTCDLGERIYVARNQFAARHVKNEVELLNLLKRYDFRVVNPENLSFEDQISIFSSARIVLGVKGAALTNMLFSPRDSHMITLSPSDWTDPFFWDLVSQRGIHYSEIYCEAHDRTNLSMANIVVNIDRLEALFKMMHL